MFAAIYPSSPQVAQPAPVPVLQALSFIRKTRLIDLYDREAVLSVAAAYGFSEAIDWMVAHREGYYRALARLKTLDLN